MSQDGNQGIKKFFSSISSRGKEREFVDTSTPRSRTQQRIPRNIRQPDNSSSYSPSPSTKRKRRLTETDLIDVKNPKITDTMANPQTPPTPVNTNTRKIDKKKLTPELEALRDEMHSDMQKIIEPLQESIKEMLLGLRECQNLRRENEDLHRRVKIVEADNIKLHQRVSQLEDKLLEGNVIITGIPESLWENSSATKEKVLRAISHTISGESDDDKMNQARNIPIKDVSRIGHYSAMCTRPVLVEFYHKSDAAFLLANRKELPSGVFVDKQYSEETERERRRLRPILKAARQHDNYKGKCRMDGPILVIKGRNYDRTNLHTLPNEINGYSATSKTGDGMIGFFGELNPLSNFHPASFMINGQKYHSSEQFIQHQKCILFNDQESGARILSADTPLDCKLISKEVKNYDHERWKQNV